MSIDPVSGCCYPNSAIRYTAAGAFAHILGKARTIRAAARKSICTQPPLPVPPFIYRELTGARLDTPPRSKRTVDKTYQRILAILRSIIPRLCLASAPTGLLAGAHEGRGLVQSRRSRLARLPALI
jgi:hypothetical protein